MVGTMKYYALLAIATFILSACGNTSQSVDGLTPMPDYKDPSDKVMKEAIADYLQKHGAPPNSTYQFKRIDLNHDRKRDAIVLFKLPHTYWCGWDGCGMLILKAGTDNFTPLSTVNGVRGPIYVRNSGKNGWKDIIIRISGVRMADKNVVLSNSGRGYTNSPMLAPTFEGNLQNMKAQRLFR